MTWPIKRLHIETSTICNSDCEICPQSLIQRQKKIDVVRVKRLITEDAVAYASTLHLVEFHNYNEPLLAFDLFCELSSLVNATFGPHKVGLVSNGSVMDEKKADRLVDLRLAHVLFSVDGFSKEVYENHRRGLDRDQVYRNIDTFIERSAARDGPVPLVNYTVTPGNAHEAIITKDHFAGRRCNFHLSACDGRGSDSGKLVAISNMNMSTNGPCDYALDGVYVLSNLDIVTCCEDWSGKDVMGNLMQSTLQEVVDGAAYQRFRELHFSGQKHQIALCRDCKTNMSYAESYKKTVPVEALTSIRATR